MKKKLPALCLSLALWVSLVPAALAAEGFTDVPAGSWFEEGVAVCAEQGVMVGTAEGVFSPDKNLTAAECLTLAVRLYDLQHGGDGVLKKAPEDWGKITLTLSDGTVMEDFSGGDTFSFWSWPKNDSWGILAKLPGETNEERQAWGDAHTGAATLTADGTDYAGSVHNFIPYGEYVFQFQPDWDEDMDLSAVRGDLSRAVDANLPGPDQWWRDAVYTAHQLGLNDATAFPGFAALLERDLSGGGAALREEFALALSDAAGDLEKKYTVETIYDVFNAETTPMVREENQSVYALYEAGILNGINEFGVFGGQESLTRAQAAVMVARVLDESQRLTQPPAAPTGYDLAVTGLRTSFGYYNEQTFETDNCTVFVYDRGGMMNAPSGAMTVIYKAGSALGEGYVLDLPHAWVKQGLAICYPADTMTLSEDGKTFTYTYYRPEDIVGWVDGVNDGEVLEKAGQITFTVDLPTGEVTETFSPLNYAGAMAHVTRKRVISNSEHSEDREVAQTLETDQCTAVLTKGRFADQYDDYILSLVYKPGSALGDGAIKQLILPSTVYDAGYPWYNPTDRAPDSLEVSEDGKTLTYVYHFDDRLAYTAFISFSEQGEFVLHEAGTYTYTVDLATGELSVTHTAD